MTKDRCVNHWQASYQTYTSAIFYDVQTIYATGFLTLLQRVFRRKILEISNMVIIIYHLRRGKSLDLTVKFNYHLSK